MASLTDEMNELRSILKNKPRFRLELISSISKQCREYGIEISDELLGSLQFAVPSEIPRAVHSFSIDPDETTPPQVDPPQR